MRARLYEHEMEKKREQERKVEASKLDINFGSQIRSYVLAGPRPSGFTQYGVVGRLPP